MWLCRVSLCWRTWRIKKTLTRFASKCYHADGASWAISWLVPGPLRLCWQLNRDDDDDSTVGCDEACRNRPPFWPWKMKHKKLKSRVVYKTVFWCRSESVDLTGTLSALVKWPSLSRVKTNMRLSLISSICLFQKIHNTRCRITIYAKTQLMSHHSGLDISTI